MAEQKEPTRRERFKVYAHVFDEGTLRAAYKLSGQGHFEEMKSPLQIGKEANIFSATKGDSLVCLKIYRIAANFKKMFEYMAPDPRYTGLRRNKISIIYAWARKEYRNLLRAREAGVRVPTPIAVFKNIVVMEFIGHNEAAPQLIKCIPQDLEGFYEMLISNIRKLYHEANLVHADLSPFNVLNFDGKPVIIDMSHAIDLQYPNARGMLERDIKVICDFFNRKGLELDYKKELERCLAKN